MDNKLENYLSMFQKVQGHAALHNTVLSAVPAIDTTLTEFNNLVSSILDTAGVTNDDLTGYTVDKQNKRDELTAVIIDVSSGYAGWAYFNNQNNEAERFDVPISKLNGMRDNDLYTYARHLISKATPLAAQLEDFLVSSTNLTNLQAFADQYLEMIQSPRVQIGERASQLIKLKNTFDEANNLLRMKLDNLMKIFKNREPEIYNSYLFARSIDDTGSISPADYEGILSPGELLNLAEIPYVSSRVFKLKNLSNSPITIGISATNTMSGSPRTVAPGSEGTYRSDTLNALGGNIILLQNESPVETSSYEIRITE